MPRLTEPEQQEIIRFIDADRPLPDKWRTPIAEYAKDHDCLNQFAA